jgi:acyl carrier protein
VLTPEEFVSELTSRIELGVAFVDASTSLRIGLDLDSVQMLEVVVLMDELGAEVPELMIPAIQTVGDLYEHYATRRGAEDGRRP